MEIKRIAEVFIKKGSILHAELYISMKRGIWPIRGAAHVPVFDWVEVDVVHVSLPIGLIAQGMFPEAALPDAALAFPDSTLGATLDPG